MAEYARALCRRIKPGFTFTFDSTPLKTGGINFAGKLTVAHPDGAEFVVHVPGKLTYDPAGRTGDPHASERVLLHRLATTKGPDGVFPVCRAWRELALRAFAEGADAARWGTGAVRRVPGRAAGTPGRGVGAPGQGAGAPGPG